MTFTPADEALTAEFDDDSLCCRLVAESQRQKSFYNIVLNHTDSRLPPVDFLDADFAFDAQTDFLDRTESRDCAVKRQSRDEACPTTTTRNGPAQARTTGSIKVAPPLPCALVCLRPVLTKEKAVN